MIRWEVLVTSIVAVIYIFLALWYLKTRNKGSKKMQEVSNIIKRGSKIFLIREHKFMGVVILIIATIIFIFDRTLGTFFIVGAVLSSFSSIVGMSIATSANVKVTASKNIQSGMRIAFMSGLIISTITTIIGLVGIYAMYSMTDNVQVLYGFGFGAALVALFLRVGGGIYTKSADVSADLVGKIETNLPEDDARNPAVIADLVGDNVGDVAGMSTDLFESYVDCIIAAMVIAIAISRDAFVPLQLASMGIVASIASLIVVRGKKVYLALLNTLIVSSLFVAIGTFFLLREYFTIVVLGLLAGVIIGISILYYTSSERGPTRKISQATNQGPALTVLRGLSNGMISTAVPVVTVAIAMIFSFRLDGIFGIAIASVSMLSVIGVTLASTAFGSISDNAAGISEMCKMKDTRKVTESLDEAGNTANAIGKGVTIGSAAFTTLVLLYSFIQITGAKSIDLLITQNLAILLIGCTLPFMFSSIIINSVSSAAEKIVEEVRRQFKGGDILKGKKKPNYDRVIDIATKYSVRKMFLPSFIAVISTVIIGLVFGVQSLASFIIGVTSSSLLLSIFMANAGASMDNAKKYIEEGNYGGKGSEAHKASVVGDTVGDPLKDAAGPSLDILIKLVAIVSLLMAITIG